MLKFSKISLKPAAKRVKKFNNFGRTVKKFDKNY